MVHGSEPGQIKQAYALFGGATAWGIHLVAGYALVPVACHSGQIAWLHVVSVLSLALTAGSILTAIAILSRSPRKNPGAPAGLHMVAALGLLMGLIFLYAISMASAANFALDPCQRGF